MVRRTINFLLILGYLATQMAAMPHAHGAGDENHGGSHDARPHTHVSWFHSERHHHCHQHDDHPSSTHSTGSRPNQEHDSDAIYLNEEIGFLSPANHSTSVVSHVALGWLAIDSRASLTLLRSHDGPMASCLEDSRSSCPLYLALRALRI